MKSKPTKHPKCVVAHQLLAAAKIIIEDLTRLGYDDKFATEEYKQLRANGHDDQSAIRMFAAAVREYDHA